MPRTDGMFVVSATVPAERADVVAKAIMNAADHNVPADGVLPESTPGKVLAAAIGVHKFHISGMKRGARPIGKAMAKKLGRALEMNWRIFLQRPKWNGERLWYLHGVTRLRNGSPRGELQSVNPREP